MISFSALSQQIRQKQSFLCIGLDSDIEKIPAHLKSFSDPVFEFNRQIVDATHGLCVAYKPNTAFYESAGTKGWESLEKTAVYIKEKHPELFLIADAKRGDIGNTSRMYAKAFFEQMPFDGLTVAPYMGSDSVKPFLEHKGKWVILLALTSNAGAADFQLQLSQNQKLFEQVLATAQNWGTPENLMFVVGATRAEKLAEVRKIAPKSFLLVPGVGAQGGSLSDVARYGLNSEGGLLVNASRSVIFAGNGKDFAQKAREKAAAMQAEMEKWVLKLPNNNTP